MSKTPSAMPLTAAQRRDLTAIHEHGAFTFEYSRGGRTRQFRLRTNKRTVLRSSNVATLNALGLVTYNRVAGASDVTLTDAGREALGLEDES